MEKTTKVLKSSSNLNLPGEVWSEILSRIPVRSLVQWRCVAKTWRALIDDPAFARLHLTRSNDISDETRFFVVQETSRGRECVVRCSKTLKTIENLAIIETRTQLSHHTLLTLPIYDGDEIGDWNVSSSVDGLIMLVSWDSREALMLWNPSIRKARRVPPCPDITQEMRTFDFGMGFDPLGEDYKHVVFVHNAEWNLQSFAIYTVGTNSWKTIEFTDDSFRCTPEEGQVICVGGVLYDVDGISFDLRSETFGIVSYPNDMNSLVYFSRLTTADCGRSLALVRITHEHGYIWVLQEKESTWIQRCKFSLAIPKCASKLWDTPRFLYLKKNGEVLLHWGTAMTSSNLETHEEKIILEESLESNNTDIWLYKESLLLLNKTF